MWWWPNPGLKSIFPQAWQGKRCLQGLGSSVEDLKPKMEEIATRSLGRQKQSLNRLWRKRRIKGTCCIPQLYRTCSYTPCSLPKGPLKAQCQDVPAFLPSVGLTPSPLVWPLFSLET